MPALTAWWTAPEPDRQVDPKLKKISQVGWMALIPLPAGIAQTLLGADASLKIEAYDWTDSLVRGLADPDLRNAALN